MHTISDLFTT